HAFVGETFVRDQALERGEPVPVIGVAEVGIAGRLCALDLRGERRRPLGPGEQALFVERDGERESLRLPWLAEHGAALVARDAGYAGGLARRLVGGVIGHG